MLSTLCASVKAFCCTAVQMIAMLATCCYCFKRKYTDVLPPYVPFSAKEYEKYRYGIPGRDNKPVKVKAPEEPKPSAVPKADEVGEATTPAPGDAVVTGMGAGTGLEPAGESKQGGPAVV